jgi:uncharacterized membrane protein
MIKSNQGKMAPQQIILILTATATALIAGCLYGYSVSVNGGLGKLSDEGYLSAMQSINRAILNPLFFASFMGALILLPLSTWLHYRSGASSSFLLLLAASLIYIFGTFIVTMAVNVPLNEALGKFNIQSATAAEIASQRLRFEVQWNRFHNIRTIAAIISLVLVIIACVDKANTIKN